MDYLLVDLRASTKYDVDLIGEMLNFAQRAAGATTRPDRPGVLIEGAEQAIRDAVGFEFNLDEMQTVNASDLMRVFHAGANACASNACQLLRECIEASAINPPGIDLSGPDLVTMAENLKLQLLAQAKRQQQDVTVNVEKPDVMATFDGLYLTPLKSMAKGEEMMSVTQHRRVVETLARALVQARRSPPPFDLNMFAQRAAELMEMHDFHGFEPVVMAVVREVLGLQGAAGGEQTTSDAQIEHLRWLLQCTLQYDLGGTLRGMITTELANKGPAQTHKEIN